MLAGPGVDTVAGRSLLADENDELLHRFEFPHEHVVANGNHVAEVGGSQFLILGIIHYPIMAQGRGSMQSPASQTLG